MRRSSAAMQEHIFALRHLTLHSRYVQNHNADFSLETKLKIYCFIESYLRYGAKQLRKPYCSHSALRCVAKVRPNVVRSNLSCGLATRPIHRRERSGRGGLGGSQDIGRSLRGQVFATKLAQRCRSTGLWKAKLFCAISVIKIYLV